MDDEEKFDTFEEIRSASLLMVGNALNLSLTEYVYRKYPFLFQYSDHSEEEMEEWLEKTLGDVYKSFIDIIDMAALGYADTGWSTGEISDFIEKVLSIHIIRGQMMIDAGVKEWEEE